MTLITLQDNRSFTEYESQCVIDNRLMRKYNIKTPTEYRLFLQRNGKLILEENKKKLDDIYPQYLSRN